MTEYKKTVNLSFRSKKLHKALKVLAVQNELTLHDMIIKACHAYVNMDEAQRKQANLMNNLDE